MKELCDLFRSLGDSLDLDETLSHFDRELRRLIEYQAMSLHLLEDGCFIPAYAAGEEFQSLASLEGELGDGFLGLAARNRCAILNCHPEGLGLMGTALVAPLERSGTVTAVIALYQGRPNLFSEEDQNTLLAVAPKLTTSIHNAREHQAAQGMAGLDPLTGVLNTRAMFHHLDAELARSRRLHVPLAVLECAIDGMDRSLPELTRRVYRQLAASLRKACREYDSVVRTGDGFVLVLPGFTPDDLKVKYARIQTAAEETGLRIGLPLSVRVGAAFFPQDSADAEGLLATAAEGVRRARAAAPGGHEKP